MTPIGLTMFDVIYVTVTLVLAPVGAFTIIWRAVTVVWRFWLRRRQTIPEVLDDDVWEDQDGDVDDDLGGHLPVDAFITPGQRDELVAWMALDVVDCPRVERCDGWNPGQHRPHTRTGWLDPPRRRRAGEG